MTAINFFCKFEVIKGFGYANKAQNQRLERNVTEASNKKPTTE